jgi:hypothetical protein
MATQMMKQSSSTNTAIIAAQNMRTHAGSRPPLNSSEKRRIITDGALLVKRGASSVR